jgi:hypothetical protein
MATTTRQTSLLVAEDWTKLYQTFRNADFQSYDYETLRKSIIDYLRLYYPEDFNDYIESSEFIALIDTIAFLGQSLAFRGDLNARENFIDTAQRRDSILKLARLISYNPKRNIAAQGFLKFDSVSSTENLFDSNGVNLSGLVINWADAGNDNWQEQFTAIINAALVSNQTISKPSNSQLINGVMNSEYQINLVSSTVPTYSFNTDIEGAQTALEMVSPTSAGENYIYEVAPRPNLPFNILYKNDGLGNFSVNTGYFTYFKQGALASVDVNFQESLPNRIFGINTDNINNTDVWVYSLNRNGAPDILWSAVPAVNGTNVIYNQGTNRNVYQVNSRAGDQIDLVFGDGSFANIPQGNFRIYYRVSNGLSYKITPSEMQGIIMPVNYVSRTGRIETITIRASLRYTVANAVGRETIEDIRQKAPQQYYTQNRMVTGEDYNILPYTLFSDVLKAKAVNRTSSGASRYLDVIDTTGKYSSTNIFAQDGLLYKDPFTRSFSFNYDTTNDIFKAITNQVKPLTSEQETLQYFYANYPLVQLTNTFWYHSTTINNGSTGYFVNAEGKPVQVGSVVASANKYIVQSAIVRFSAGVDATGNLRYFDARNIIQTGTPRNTGDKYYIYAAVVKLVGDGTNGGLGNLANGQGPLTINQIVPDGAVADKVFAAFNVELVPSLVTSMVSYIQAYQDFGLRYDIDTTTWRIILPGDLNTGEFDLSNTGNTSGSGLDSSWLIRFQALGQTYTVFYRGLNYVFESVKETNFYFDDNVNIFDPKLGTTVHDQIKILKINSQPDTNDTLALDYQWYIYKNIIEVDGYENPSKIYITFPDVNNDGIPDNPELFELIVNPAINADDKYVYFQNTIGYDNFVIQVPVDNNLILSNYNSLREIEVDRTQYQTGQLFYVPNTNMFYQLTIVGSNYNINQIDGYVAKVGRQDLYFQYRHNSPNYRRIDPSPNNIIDLYLLPTQYATDYTAWIRDTSNSVAEPTAPTGEVLGLNYSSLENFKSISDTIIYNSARFKPIFGSKADLNLQATFKIVKNAGVVVGDNDIKTSVIAAINAYFDIANWDFGETFYFSELAAYLHNQLAPNISSVLIVPNSQTSTFGSLMQINAEYNEIIQSAATVDNVQIISAITAAQLNQREGTVITDVASRSSSGSLPRITSGSTSSSTPSTGGGIVTPSLPSGGGTTPPIYTPPSGGSGGGY